MLYFKVRMRAYATVERLLCQVPGGRVKMQRTCLLSYLEPRVSVLLTVLLRTLLEATDSLRPKRLCLAQALHCERKTDSTLAFCLSVVSLLALQHRERLLTLHGSGASVHLV